MSISGPSVLEVFHNLVKHLRISLDNKSSDEQQRSLEKKFEDDLVNTIGKDYSVITKHSDTDHLCQTFSDCLQDVVSAPCQQFKDIGNAGLKTNSGKSLKIFKHPHVQIYRLNMVASRQQSFF